MIIFIPILIVIVMPKCRDSLPSGSDLRRAQSRRLRLEYPRFNNPVFERTPPLECRVATPRMFEPIWSDKRRRHSKIRQIENFRIQLSGFWMRSEKAIIDIQGTISCTMNIRIMRWNMRAYAWILGILAGTSLDREICSQVLFGSDWWCFLSGLQLK
jgi:hypothetical protein